MIIRFFKITLLNILLVVFALSNFPAISLPSNSEGERRGFTLFDLPSVVARGEMGRILSDQEECQTREECEEMLKRYEEEIQKLERAVAKTKQEQRTIQNQIRILRSTIQRLDLQVKQGNVMIKDLSYQIEDTEGSIKRTSFKIEDSREKLVGLLRTINEEDQKSSIEILFSGETLSDFFDNLMALETLNLKSQEFLGEIKNLKETLEQQKALLDDEKSDLEDRVRMQMFQRQESEATRREQERLRRMTEAQYKQYIEQKEITEQRAAEIRARIFQLVGIPDVEMPTFGQALEIAQWVQQQSGIRPALLLSIITQESALARNVGQCYLSDTSSGRTYHIVTGRQFSRGINPVRDLPLFLQITKELGRDPLRTPVSCWIDVGRGPRWGWGGAMGPAQFIPSTWMNVRNRVSSVTGNSPANPWSVRDSFLAAGLYLRELGAVSNELLAAGRYFGAPGLLAYDSTVVRRANCLQRFIDRKPISAECERLIFTP